LAERRRPHHPDRVAVIGLGRFGGQVADALVRLGHEVLAVDGNGGTVEKWTERLTYVVQADATQVRVLRQLGIHEFPRVVVGIGRALEASVLTVLALAEVGVPEIWAKSTSNPHSRILSAVGATRVIFPESAMGDRVAHSSSPTGTPGSSRRVCSWWPGDLSSWSASPRLPDLRVVDGRR
jgi:trk system potassium uptake protein TrkA